MPKFEELNSLVTHRNDSQKTIFTTLNAMKKLKTLTSETTEQEKSASELERFEEPYWGETPKLTPEQIVEWLEGHREMMSLVKRSSGVPDSKNS